jgi:hypothetical protein
MTKYEEMVQAAEEGRKNWIRRHESSTRFIYQLLLRFRKACEIPEEHLRILPWNEKAETFGGKELPLTAALSATRYDVENDNWQAGVVIYFNEPNYFSRLFATFVLFVTENDGKLTVRIGEPGKPLAVDTNVQTQVEEFINSLSKEIEEAIKEPTRKRRVKVHGFEVPVASEQEAVI